MIILLELLTNHMLKLFKKYLENYKLVSDVRGIYAFTGTYKNKEVTIMASGMGMPSMGIYSYELFKFYNVENIIRIGSCGAMVPELDMFDVILCQKVFTEGNYALTLASENCHIVEPSKILNEKIINTAKEKKSKIKSKNLSLLSQKMKKRKKTGTFLSIIAIKKCSRGVVYIMTMQEKVRRED